MLSRKQKENAIAKRISSSDKKGRGVNRVIMLTGNLAKSLDLPSYTTMKMIDFTDSQIDTLYQTLYGKVASSEILRNLESRVARLEKQAQTKIVGGDIVVATNNRTGSITFYMVESYTDKTVKLTKVGEEYVRGDYNSGGLVKPNIFEKESRSTRHGISYDSRGNVSVNMKGYSTRIWDYKPVKTHGAL